MKVMPNFIASSKKSGAGATRQYENLLELLATHDSLCGFAVVTFQDATEFGFASNSAFRLRNEVLVQNSVVSPDTAMRALLVIMFQPHTKDVVELSSTKANEVIQDLSLCSSDEAFAECIRHRGAWWDFNGPDVSLFPERIEGMRVLSIAISNHEPGIDTFVLHPHRRVACLLHYPFGIGMIGARTAEDFSSTQMNKHKYIGVAYPAEREYSFRKEIASNYSFNMGMDKGRPGYGRSLSSFLGIGNVTLPFKDVSDGGRADADTQFLEFSEDTTVSPAEILPGQSQDQVTRREGRAGSTGKLVCTPSTQLPQPLSVRSRNDNVHQFANVVVYRRTQSKQFHPFSGSRHNSACIDPSAEHSDLRLKKLNPSVVSGPQPLCHELH